MTAGTLTAMNSTTRVVGLLLASTLFIAACTSTAPRQAAGTVTTPVATPTSDPTTADPGPTTATAAQYGHVIADDVASLQKAWTDFKHSGCYTDGMSASQRCFTDMGTFNFSATDLVNTLASAGEPGSYNYIGAQPTALTGLIGATASDARTVDEDIDDGTSVPDVGTTDDVATLMGDLDDWKPYLG